MIDTKGAIVAALLILGGLALWWQWGLLVVLADPMWLCAPR